MTKINYNKQPLTFEEQVNLLKTRNLLFGDEQKSIHILSQINYYRLSAYFYPLLEEPKELHKFKNDSYFEDSFNLYLFDRELRQLIFNEIEKIEISLRTKIIYHISHAHGAFWFEDDSLFFDKKKHKDFIEDLKNEAYKSKEDSNSKNKEIFLNSFYKKYTNDLPPSWMSLEIITLGQLSHLYSNIIKDLESKKKIAQEYNLNPELLVSWMHSLNYVRNICAHHSRLWNKQLRITPKTLPSKTIKPWLSSRVPNNKVFFVLSIIFYLIQHINPKSCFKSKLKDLLSKYPKTDKGTMGFPLNWENEPLWNI